jgi:membrane protease YdiL (CAAX protease family)
VEISPEHPPGVAPGTSPAPGASAAAVLPPPPIRSTLPETWDWVWKDTLFRLAPFAAAALVYAKGSGKGLRGLGLTREELPREIGLGVALGLPMLGASIAFRAWDTPRYRLPTSADQALQSTFYFGLNAPIEEIFWRGAVQNLAIDGLRRVPRVGPVATPLGWALTTAVFGAYHRLGNWRWRSIAGVTVAGAAFGATYLASRRRSLVSTIIVHGFATAGYLSWGDAALHVLRHLRTSRT